MALLEIPVRKDIYSYEFQISLQQQVYFFEIKYNSRMQRWQLSVYDDTKTPLVLGINILTETDMTSQYIDRGLPPGLIFVVDTEGAKKDADLDDFGDRIKVMYEEAV